MLYIKPADLTLDQWLERAMTLATARKSTTITRRQRNEIRVAEKIVHTKIKRAIREIKILNDAVDDNGIRAWDDYLSIESGDDKKHCSEN